MQNPGYLTITLPPFPHLHYHQSHARHANLWVQAEELGAAEVLQAAMCPTAILIGCPLCLAESRLWLLLCNLQTPMSNLNPSGPGGGVLCPSCSSTEEGEKEGERKEEREKVGEREERERERECHNHGTLCACAITERDPPHPSAHN